MYVGQQDPIGLTGRNPTLYAYVHNPLISIDPYGLDPFVPEVLKTGSVFKGMPEANLFSPSARDLAMFEITGNMPGFSTFLDGDAVKSLMKSGKPMFADVAEIDVAKLGPNLQAVWDSPKGHVSIMPSDGYLKSNNSQ